jgi:hypothetical protein
LGFRDGGGAGRAVGSTKMMAEGLLKGGRAFFSDPAGCIKSIYKDVDAATDKLAQACAYVADNPDETWERVKAFSSRAATRVGAMSAEEVAEASGAFVGEALTLLAAVVGPASKVRAGVGLARTFASLARAEIVATAALVAKSPGFQNILQPLCVTCREAALFCTSGVRSPVQFARRIAALRSIPGKDARRAFMRVCGCLGKSSPEAPQAFKEALQKFASTPGFSDRAEAIVGRIARANGGGVGSAVKGAYYELEAAFELERTGEKIVAFGKQISGKDFDVVTLRRLIECKNIHWPRANLERLKDQCGQLARIARDKGKIFEFWSKTPIVSQFKDWLIRKGIIFREGI